MQGVGLMPADDVTQDQPLRGGRQRANHIQVHRVELGAWERKRMESMMPMYQIDGMVKPAVALIGVGSLAAVGIAIYMSGRAIYGWGEEITNSIGSAWDEATGGMSWHEPIIGKGQYERDGGGTYTNPFYPIPVLSPLFGTGINLGKAIFE